MELPIKQKYIISKNVLFGFRKDVPIRVIINNFSSIEKSSRDKFTDQEINENFGFLPINDNKYSERNCERWYLIDKSKPKELYSYDLWCTRYRWAGRGKSEPYYDWVSINRMRYHRDYFDPYEVNFFFDKEKDCVVSDSIPFNDANFNKIKNTINLVLKMFGECIVSDGDNEYLGKIEIVKWRFLPSGHWTDDKEKIIQRTGRGKKQEIENFMHDLEILYSFKPQKVAIGENGFRGYVAMCFENQKVCILESKFPLNATYVFDIDFWEDLSKKTKTNIIEAKLAKHRFYHNKNWKDEITKVLEK